MPKTETAKLREELGRTQIALDLLRAAVTWAHTLPPCKRVANMADDETPPDFLVRVYLESQPKART